VRDLGAEDAADRGVAVRDVDAGDLVVAVVVAGAGRGVVERGGVTTLGEPTGDLGSVVVLVAELDEVAGVEGVALGVQGVPGVFDDEEMVRTRELDVVQAGVCLVADEDRGEAAGGRGG